MPTQNLIGPSIHVGLMSMLGVSLMCFELENLLIIVINAVKLALFRSSIRFYTNLSLIFEYLLGRSHVSSSVNSS